MLSTLDHVQRKHWPIFHGRPAPVFEIDDGSLRLVDHVCDQLLILMEPIDWPGICITHVIEEGGELVIRLNVPAG